MDRSEWKDILKQHPIFSVLTKDEIERLLNASTGKNYNPDQTILQVGEESQSAYLVGAGEVNVMLPWKGGEVPVSTLKKNDFFGEMAAIEAKPRAATVRAASPCSLLEIPRKDFLKLLNEHSDIELKVAASLSSRLRRIGEEVLRRQKELHEDIQSLDGRLNAELKAMDAALKASEAMFDQTSKRANEIIESADRARTRLTTIASAVGTIVGIAMALFAWFGLNELVDVREERKHVSDLVEKAKTDLENIDQILEQFGAFKRDFYLQIMIPAFKQELNDNPDGAPDYYRAILQAEDPLITDRFFDEYFVYAIFYYGGDLRKQSREMLEKGLRDVKTPRQTILSYYLILSALALDGEQGEFDKTFRRFQEYMMPGGFEPIRVNLAGDFGKRKFKSMDFLPGDPDAEEKKEKIIKVWELMP